MFGKLRGFAVVSVLAVWAAGCGGLSKEDAELRCNQERAAKSATFTDAVYAQCVACYEKCGDSCLPIESTPAAYQCDGLSGTGGGGTGGTGGGN